MHKRLPQIEWHILDEEAEKHAANPSVPVWSEEATEVDTQRSPWTSVRSVWLHVLAGFCCFALVFGYWLWQRAETGLEQVDTALDNTTQTGLWIAAHGETGHLSKLAIAPEATAWREQFLREDATLGAQQAISPQAPLAVDLDIIELGEDWAVVEMTAEVVRVDGTTNAYRQKRFYHYSDDGWQRTVPTAEAWGTPTLLETEHFFFRFRQLDAITVAEVAPQIEALYLNLRNTFGLDMDRLKAKMVVEVSPTEPPGATLLRQWKSGHYRVPSPALYLAPVTVTDGELILQTVALYLIADTVNEATAYYQMRWVRELLHSGQSLTYQFATAHYQMRWMRERMTHALRLWALWDSELPLATMRHQVVQAGLAGELNATERAELCAIYSVWLPSPMLLSIPLNCDRQTFSVPPSSSPQLPSIAELEQLTGEIFWLESARQGGAGWVGQPDDSLKLATLIEYVVHYYGREKLSVLLVALGRYGAWAVLAPEVFGVSSAEFAAGWREYLEAEYDLVESR